MPHRTRVLRPAASPPTSRTAGAGTVGRWILSALLGLLAFPSRAEFRAGAVAIDVTPETLPVLVNGGMYGRHVAKLRGRLHARALALSDGTTQVALVVVDSCMMPRPMLDEVKVLAARQTGIPTNRILLSATHAHSAPSSMGCLGTDADPAYVAWVRGRLVQAVVSAQSNLEPARVGFGKVDAGAFNAVRQWIRRPDRMALDPFGNRTVRANMHAGAQWDDVTGEAGPKDPDLCLVSVQARDGRPLAVLGNFAMHYFSEPDLGADYFGLFADGLKERLAPKEVPGRPPFVGIQSQGCSGDIWRRDYTKPATWDPALKIEDYTRGLLDLAVQALQGVRYRDDVSLAMAERRMTLDYRVPDRQRLEWARRVVDGMGDRPARTEAEVYAREQLFLAEKQRTEIVLQALRLGDIVLAAVPTETYALTGLKIKAASPLEKCLVIELANGGDGYVPPPEQHPLGGYNTWAARSAGLEVQAEPKITGAVIGLLEEVSMRPRRPWRLPDGAAVRSALRLRPFAYWRLDEFTGPIAADATGHGRDATYESGITFHLEGPRSEAFCGVGAVNRAPHLAGGRVRARLAGLGERHSVSLWFWNGLPTDAREVSGWLLSRGPDHGLDVRTEHLGLGGRGSDAGRLMLHVGGAGGTRVAGRTEIPRWQWHHAVLVRDRSKARVYLDGRLEIEVAVAPWTGGDRGEWFLGGRSDGDATWEGRLDEVAVFDRALGPAEVRRLMVP